VPSQPTGRAQGRRQRLFTGRKQVKYNVFLPAPTDSFTCTTRDLCSAESGTAHPIQSVGEQGLCERVLCKQVKGIVLLVQFLSTFRGGLAFISVHATSMILPDLIQPLLQRERCRTQLLRSSLLSLQQVQKQQNRLRKMVQTGSHQKAVASSTNFRLLGQTMQSNVC
jgi:hypothetical protein